MISTPDTTQATEAANPILTRVLRGGAVESVHRGAWVWVDSAAEVVDGGGDIDRAVFARSSTKSLQALPFLEGGAAERFGAGDEDVALALASHNAEAQHTDRVRAHLGRLGLPIEALQCGPQAPTDPEARRGLEAEGTTPSGLYNNCSGKHAAFLALALHHGMDPADYLDPEGPAQREVRDALQAMTGTPDDRLDRAVDGCSAPTFRLPLRNLATGLARVANPGGLDARRAEACLRMQSAVAAHPDLIAGKHKRLCTDLARVTGGRVFPKIGAEGVYVLGVVGADRGLAVKVDDGNARGMHALVIELLERAGFLSEEEAKALEPWRGKVLRNWAGLEIGTTEVFP